MLLGIATYRARALPRSVGALMVVGALAMLTLEQIGSIFLGMDALWAVGPVMLGAGMAWLGYNLWSRTPRVLGERRSGRAVRLVVLAAEA